MRKTLHEITIEELQERLKQAVADTEAARAELEDAEEIEEDIRDEIEARYRTDREKLASWNAAVREAKTMARS